MTWRQLLREILEHIDEPNEPEATLGSPAMIRITTRDGNGS